MSLDPSRQRRLVAAARLLESDKGGDRQAALEAVLRLLPQGMTLAALLEQALAVPVRPDCSRPKPREWQSKAGALLARSDKLTAKELVFVTNMAGARFEPSEGQSRWLDDLAQKLEAFA